MFLDVIHNHYEILPFILIIFILASRRMALPTGRELSNSRRRVTRSPHSSIHNERLMSHGGRLRRDLAPGAVLAAWSRRGTGYGALAVALKDARAEGDILCDPARDSKSGWGGRRGSSGQGEGTREEEGGDGSVEKEETDAGKGRRAGALRELGV